MQANGSDILNLLLSEQLLRFSVLMVIMLVASVRDIRTRIIPDLMPVLIAAVSFIPSGHPYILGVLVALPLLMAGVVYGGIGGGDIKIVGAVGLVLGFERTLAGLMLALIFMLAFHNIRKLPVFAYRRSMEPIQNKKESNHKKDSYPMVPFLTAGMLTSFLLFLYVF